MACQRPSMPVKEEEKDEGPKEARGANNCTTHATSQHGRTEVTLRRHARVATAPARSKRVQMCNFFMVRWRTRGTATMALSFSRKILSKPRHHITQPPTHSRCSDA